MLFLCACSQNTQNVEIKNTPVISDGLTFDALYTTGDFSFNCTVKWSGGTAYVTVNSTNAAGLTISCDGQNVTFSKGNMIKSEKRENIDSTNPAVLLWEAFTAMENDGSKTSLGAFETVADEKGVKQINFSSADITIKRL